MHILFFLCELIGYPFFSRAQLEQWDVLTPKYPFIIVTFVCRVQYGACGRIYNQLQSVSVCVRALCSEYLKTVGYRGWVPIVDQLEMA